MKPGGSFWDLGAGVGKLVIAAAVVQNFEVSDSYGSVFPMHCAEHPRKHVP